MEEESDLELRGDGGVQEILSFVPGNLVMYGNVIIVAILMMLLASSWFIKYPEIIDSKVIVMGQNPTVQHIAQTSGKLVLYVKNNQLVKKGEYLAIIENSANIEDIRQLSLMLTAQERALNLSNDSVILDFDRPLLLGDLQTDYSNLKQQYNTYKAFRRENYLQRKMNNISGQYDYYRNLNTKLSGQSSLLKRDFELAKVKYDRDKKLLASKVISQMDMDKSEADFLQKEYAYKNTEISMVNNEIQVKDYEKNMLDLDQQFREQQRQYNIAFQESFKKMQSSLAAWEQRFTIKSTIDGKVSLFKFFSNNQFVNINEEILSVIPVSNQLIARCLIPLYGSGKVKPGQQVNIKLDGFPYREFGMLEGRVRDISLATRDNFYLAEVTLPKGLVTTYNRKLEFRNEMSGSAEIITEDLRLIERLFYQVRSVIRK
ncbi:MAG: hypothetical protein V4616_05875 [Bacteroidota bacterium]